MSKVVQGAGLLHPTSDDIRDDGLSRTFLRELSSELTRLQEAPEAAKEPKDEKDVPLAELHTRLKKLKERKRPEIPSGLKAGSRNKKQRDVCNMAEQLGLTEDTDLSGEEESDGDPDDDQS